MNDPVVGGAKNKYLRQAITAAIDTETLITKFYNGRAVSAQGPISPGVVGYDSSLKNPYKPFNLEKAKSLMEKAGYPNGKGLLKLLTKRLIVRPRDRLSNFFSTRWRKSV